MQLRSYRILLRKEPEGGYTVTVPSLPGCVTYGETVEEAIEMAKEAIGWPRPALAALLGKVEEAIEMAKEAIELYLESLAAHGEEIPTEEHTFEYTLTVGAYA